MNIGKTLLALGLFCVTTRLAGQTVNVNFNDNTITNFGSGDDPSYVIQEIEQNPGLVNYVDGMDGKAVLLDSTSGFRLPTDVSQVLRNSTLWVLKMRFKIPAGDWPTKGRYLFDLRRGGGGNPYIRIYTYGWRDQLGLQLLMDDGAGNQVRLTGPIYDFDEWVSMTFIIDFEAGAFTLQTDTYLQTGNFTFDFETFMTRFDGAALQNQHLNIGQYSGLTFAQQGAHPTRNAIDLIIDDFYVGTTLPATDQGIFENALQQLTDHLNGVIVLTDEEIDKYVGEGLSNFRDNYLVSKTYVDSYLEAYEATHEPMFNHNDSRNFYEEYDSFSALALNLQLDIFDNYATTDHIDNVVGIGFETAQFFPGPVDPTAARLDAQAIPINGTYLADPGYNMKVREENYGGFARRGTGLYAPPGELITVEVPDALVNIGATVIIGTHNMDLSNKLHGIQRFPRVMKEFDIVQNEMKTINPVGGVIYIGIPEGTDLGSIDVMISGAVKFAYYESSSTRQTDIAEFYQLRDAEVTRWCEAVTDNAMFTAELTFFSRNDVKETVEMYDKMWEAYQNAFGRPFPLHKAEHFTHDKNSIWNTLAGGYPMNLVWNQAPFSGPSWVNVHFNMMNVLDGNNYQGDHKVTYWHEMSHHTALPTIINPVNEHEVIVGLAYVITFNEGFGLPLDSAMKYSERRRVTRDEAIIDWVVMDNFMNNEEMVQSQRQYQQRGWSKYVDVAALFGWEGLGSINQVFYDQWTAMGGQLNDPDLNLIKDSEWHLASNQALNQNMAPLNHFWGEHPHDTLVATLNAFPRSLEVYTRLRYIRDFIPTTFDEFEPYYNKLAPTNSNNQNYQPYQNAYADWEGTYDKIIAQIDWILEEYYGSDFDQDGFNFLEDCDDTDASIINYDQALSIEECESYEFNGEVLFEDGIYNAAFTSVHGCDSLVQIDLLILEPSFSEQVTASCDNYEWNGINYSASGVYEAFFLNTVGCDSTATLNLTILESSSSEATVETCEPYDWNGKIYTETGTYEELFSNSVGCDSVAYLNLTIFESISGEAEVTVCDQYDWHGDVITTSGVHEQLLTSTAGCDSTATVYLTILESSSSEETVETCKSYNWNGVVYTETGIYEERFSNELGCDSVAYLNLTILESSEFDDCDDIVTSKDDLSVQEIALYPNPTTNDYMSVSGFHEEATYKLIDATGKLVASGILEKKVFIPSRGSYTLFIKSGNTGSSFRVVRE